MSFPILDIILVLLLLCFLLFGLIKGFWRSLFAFLTGFVTLVVAILLAKPLASLLDGWFHISGALANSFHGGIESYVSQHYPSLGWMGTAMNIILRKDYHTLVDGDDTSNLVNTFSQELGYLALVLICVIVLYIVIRIVLKLLSKVLKKITEKGVMKGVDKSLGAVFGLLKGVVIVFVFFGVMFELSSFITPVGEWLNSMLVSNPISKLVYGWSTTIMKDVVIPFLSK